MKLSQSTAKILFAPAVGLVMSGAMSFALTIINQGFGDDFIYKWLSGFGISFLVALPISAVVVPQIQKFFDRITEKSATAENLSVNVRPGITDKTVASVDESSTT